MSELNRSNCKSKEDAKLKPQGPNLVLLYSLIALALAAAIGFAMLIVRPFYNSRH